jgi:hypothetical protein
MTDKPTPSPFLDRARFLGIGLAVGLILGGASAAYVWVQGQSEVSEVSASADREREAARAREADVQGQLDAERRRAAILTARVEVARANRALDEQNFGLVREHAEAASVALGGVEGASDVAGRLRIVQVDPMVPESARATLRALGVELEGMVPK